MKTLFTLFFVLAPIISYAQSIIQAGPTVSPMSAWGVGIVGDFHVVKLAPHFSLGVGAMAFAGSSKSYDEPNSGLKVFRFYAAPQVSFRYAFTDIFDAYLRGGPGWLGDKKEGFSMVSKIIGNGVVGIGFSFSPHVGVYAEAGLPFSSLGMRLIL